MLGFLIVGMTLMGLTFGPMSAVLPELFPTNVRYTGSGISYNMASIIGAPSPVHRDRPRGQPRRRRCGHLPRGGGCDHVGRAGPAPETRDVELTKV